MEIGDVIQDVDKVQQLCAKWPESRHNEVKNFHQTMMLDRFVWNGAGDGNFTIGAC